MADLNYKRFRPLGNTGFITNLCISFFATDTDLTPVNALDISQSMSYNDNWSSEL